MSCTKTTVAHADFAEREKGRFPHYEHADPFDKRGVREPFIINDIHPFPFALLDSNSLVREWDRTRPSCCCATTRFSSSHQKDITRRDIIKEPPFALLSRPFSHHQSTPAQFRWRVEPSSSTHEWGTDQMFAEDCVRLRLSSSLLTTFLDPLSQKPTDLKDMPT